jgi:hypothetical protein
MSKGLQLGFAPQPPPPPQYVSSPLSMPMSKTKPKAKPKPNKNIIIVGNYNRNNLGDDQYRFAFQYIFETFLPDFKSYHIEYIHWESVKLYTFSDHDIILLGGGNILNQEVLDAIHDKFTGKSNKIIAVSVGIPSIEMVVNTEKLSIIDFIFVRALQDIKLLEIFYDKTRIFYLPDISYFLTNVYNNQYISLLRENNANYQDTILKLNTMKEAGRKIIAISLKHDQFESNTESYNVFVKAFAKCCVAWIKKRYFLLFIPFSQSDADTKQNDKLIHTDVITQMNILSSYWVHKSNILNIEFHLGTIEIFSLYKYFYVTIPMRYHACLFSLYHSVPMLPLVTTKKLKNLLCDISWEHMYEVYEGLDETVLLDKMHNLKTRISSTVRIVFMVTLPNSNQEHLDNAMYKTSLSIKYLLKSQITNIVQMIEDSYEKKMNILGNKNVYHIVENLVSHLNLLARSDDNGGVDDFFMVKNKKLQKLMIDVASFHLTHSFESRYKVELKKQMFSSHSVAVKTFTEIFKDCKCKSEILNNNHNGIFNMNFVKQQGENPERRTCDFLYQSIKHLHNESSPFLLDLSIDKTFHWKCNAYYACGIIPYTQEWFGILHHTFDTEYNEYNNFAIIENELFLESLKCCKGIIVFSNYLKSQLQTFLHKEGYKIHVYACVQPTKLDDIPTFSWDKFVENPTKKLLHIGGWLRNLFLFYYLTIPDKCRFKYRKKFHCFPISTEDTFQKVILKGNKKGNHYPTEHTLHKLSRGLYYDPEYDEDEHADEDEEKTRHLNILPSSNIENTWSKHFIEYMDTTFDNVKTIDFVSNDDYDELLTKNIVFLHLIDASVMKTVLECIARNTPIIVNRHPAVVELLGESYPLFYDSLDSNEHSSYFRFNTQVHQILENTNLIREAHIYMTNMDKTQMDVKYFIEYLKHLVGEL